MYALKLAEDGRILEVMFEQYATEDMPRVEALPEHDVEDHKYIDGEYVYDPLPEPEPPVEEPTAIDDLQSLVVDLEYRTSLLELGLTEEEASNAV